VRGFVSTLVVAFLCGVASQGAAATPAAAPCTDARVDGDSGPCLIVSEQEARRALTCLRVELPECEAHATNRVALLEAELAAERDRTATQLDRADKLAALLDASTAPPKPTPSPWRTVAAVVGFTVAAVGSLVLGFEHDRDEVAVPVGLLAGSGLVVGIVATIDP